MGVVRRIETNNLQMKQIIKNIPKNMYIRWNKEADSFSIQYLGKQTSVILHGPINESCLYVSSGDWSLGSANSQK